MVSFMCSLYRCSCLACVFKRLAGINIPIIKKSGYLTPSGGLLNGDDFANQIPADFAKSYDET